MDAERLKLAMMAIVFGLALVFTILRASDLLTWNTSVIDVGPVVVEGVCDEGGSLRSPIWECPATVVGATQIGAGRSLDAAEQLSPAGPEIGVDVSTAEQVEAGAVAPTLGTEVILRFPRSGRLAERPYVGLEVDSFARRSASAVVYPQSSQLPEVTRLYLSLMARLVMLVGSALWLFGWLLERRLPLVDALDALERSVRSRPDVWRSRGVLWITIGLALSLINLVIIGRLIGSLGTV